MLGHPSDDAVPLAGPLGDGVCSPLSTQCKKRSQDRLGSILANSGILHNAVRAWPDEDAFVRELNWLVPIWEKACETVSVGAKVTSDVESAARHAISWHRHIKVVNDVIRFCITWIVFPHDRQLSR